MASARLSLDRASSALHLRLLKAQSSLARQGRGGVILIGGNDRLAASALANRLQGWFDARTVEVCAPDEGDASLEGRPFLWPYWLRMPAKGRLTVVVGDWATRTALEATRGSLEGAELAERLRALRQFEELLVASDLALAKVWFATPRKSLRRRLEEADDSEAEGWVVADSDLLLAERKAVALAGLVRRLSSAKGHAWAKVSGADAKSRDLAAGRQIGQQLLRARPRLPAPPKPSRLRPRGLLETAVHPVLGKDEYASQVRKWQLRIGRLTREAARRGIPTVLVFEGPDAAGKGGVIRRLCAWVDAGHLAIHPTPAPSTEEKARHYLWRFWNRLPPPGRMAVFDRSWYGRVLVERVEGFCRTVEWQRAYGEINGFEARLAEAGAVVLKFWLHLSKAEQLRRFRSREESPHKRHKMTAEDYRNRAKWDVHLRAAEDMVARTDTPHAPWVVVPADDKRHARVTVLRAVARALADRLDR
jgi:polyphosphate kinase 2 (PPK2 family)